MYVLVMSYTYSQIIFEGGGSEMFQKKQSPQTENTNLFKS